jgi:hypothetical protein
LKFSQIEVVAPAKRNGAPLAFEASKFELSKRERLERRYERPFLLRRQELFLVPKAVRETRQFVKQWMLNGDHASPYGRPKCGNHRSLASARKLTKSVDLLPVLKVFDSDAIAVSRAGSITQSKTGF